MIRLVLVSSVKLGILFGAVMSIDNVMGLPFGHSWFDGFIVGYAINVIFGSAVNSLVEPDDDSSKLYVWIYRYGHLVLNRSTTYFTHKSLWKYLNQQMGKGKPEEGDIQ